MARSWDDVPLQMIIGLAIGLQFNGLPVTVTTVMDDWLTHSVI
jgi:hypothetical protein